MIESIRPTGEVEGIIEHRNGTKEFLSFKNTVLNAGRATLAKSLANQIGDSGFSNYVAYMVFGQGGTSGGSPKYVGAERTSLFSQITGGSKPVIANVDGGQVIFTSVLTFDEFGPGHAPQTIDEMGLRLANNDLYSMVTFPILTKTSSMQITWNWRLTFI